ncbi:phage tail protein [Weissella oryzae SG25]|uniref:Phage tail protein n=1 Tax=Weissella oryzae (strain DSM 25784 / JCM 18191 / LMG 30913 / SG25) TaxID=1329250 RepID=A0A069CSJ6_WEIOS|nr:DUF806 family protein [Weissella oryzae]GAK30218.1 phage tail protein [Weissella oryzae SG25]
MDRPVVLAQQTILNGKFPIDDVYLDEIPAEILKNDDLTKTQVLLKEARNEPSGWGNETFTSLDVAVDIQIFYSLDFNENMTMFEVNLMKAFEKDGWRIASSQPHYLDISSSSDMHQTIKNITVSKNITL